MWENYEWTQCDMSLFPGFYNSVLDANDIIEYYSPDADDRIYDFPDEQSYRNFAQKVCDYFIREIQQRYVYSWFYVDAGRCRPIKRIIRRMKFKRLYSPQFYNFETDRLIIDCEINRWEILRYIFNNKHQFEMYLREHYTSCSGFVSFVKNSLAGILRQPEYFWNVALDFIFLQETEIEEEVDDICEELRNRFALDYLVCINEDEIFDEDDE